MAYFLAKTEPGTYSIDDLKKDQQTEWDGVRNPFAVQAIKSMRPGDQLIIYHSGKERAVVGLAEVTSDPRPDENDTRSWVMDVKYVQHAGQPVTLAQVKESGKFDDMALVRQGRLSTMAVPDAFWTWLQQMGAF
jgi:predicted RNA-binding protein with PUA-like domain